MQIHNKLFRRIVVLMLIMSVNPAHSVEEFPQNLFTTSISPIEITGQSTISKIVLPQNATETVSLAESPQSHNIPDGSNQPAVSSNFSPKIHTPVRDDAFDSWITYDDGVGSQICLAEDCWARVSFTPEARFVLQGINFQALNNGPNTDDPCQIFVFREDQETHDLTDLVWQTIIRQLDPHDCRGADYNWNYIEIPVHEWMSFLPGESFSILYGLAPGGEYTERNILLEGFEDFELNEWPGGAWVCEETGESTISVSDDEVYEGEQSLRFHDAVDRDGEFCRLSYQHAEAASGRISFRLRLSPNGYFGFVTGSGNFLETRLQFNEDASIYIQNGNALIEADTEWPANEWFNVVIDFSAESDEYSVIINDEVTMRRYQLGNGNPFTQFLFICYSDAVMENAYLDELTFDFNTEETEGDGWWITYDDATETGYSYILYDEDVCTDHAAWEAIEGDLLIRANGEYFPDYPNLQIASASCEPEEFEAGDEITISYSLANSGIVEAMSSQTRFVLSNVSVVGPDLATLGTQDEEGLGVDETHENTFTCVFPDDVEPGYYYLIVQSDHTGSVMEGDFEDDNTRAIPITIRPNEINLNNRSGIPNEFSMSANYPNPFNAITNISYALPTETFVSMRVYDISGNLIESIVDCHQAAGYHTTSWNAGTNVSGIYFVKMETNAFQATRKVMLVK